MGELVSQETLQRDADITSFVWFSDAACHPNTTAPSIIKALEVLAMWTENRKAQLHV